MLVIMKRKATEADLEQVKQFLVEQDCDFHQSTGVDRIILGVVGDTSLIDCDRLKKQEQITTKRCCKTVDF